MSANEYSEFVSAKLRSNIATGIVDPPDLSPSLFEFQRDAVRWALKRGRCALFEDTGLGKSRQQVEWARQVHEHTQRDVLILAPLAVASQTAAEGLALGVDVHVCRDAEDVRTGINITNYDRLHRFDCSRFGAVVLDESSCIKHADAKTLASLLVAFRDTPFKLCATATPAPNDYTELGTHAEFLGVCSRAEMLAEFFVHDGGETQTWRLKGHARAAFWRWVASWALLIRRPSDIGYDDGAYSLPSLDVVQHTVAADQNTVRRSGMLFAEPASGLMERRNARKASTDTRVAMCAERVNADQQPWIVWCELNAESEALAKAIPGAIEVRGSDTIEQKESALADFAEGRTRVLITKPSIAGWGMNWQHCCRVAFVGVSDSWESYYQAVRRCWRYGQTRPVEVHLYASEIEGSVVANLRRKERDAAAMAEALAAETRDAVRAEVRGAVRTVNAYAPSVRMKLPKWLRKEVA
jgi:hypothetical protein